jgi:hypothetical protein
MTSIESSVRCRQIAWAIGAALLALCLAATSTPAAAFSYTGGAYTQNFDGLPTNITNASQVITGKGPHEFSVVSKAAGLDGWQLANPGGSSSDTEFRSQDGSLSGSTGRGVLSLGTNGSAERSLGTLATSNQISTFGLVLKNDSSQTFTEFTLSYTGEQWRRGDVTSPNKLAFSFGEGAGIGASLTNFAALNFTAPNTQATPTNVALDGNINANRTAITSTVTGLNWAPGETLVLRWAGQDQSGQDDGLAIDDLTFAAHVVPEPSTAALALLGAVGVLCGAWRRRANRVNH